MNIENAIVIINKTRLETLVERFNTRAQARFYIEHAGGDFRNYETEHETFHRSLDHVVETIRQQLKFKVIDRSFVPNFLFGEKDLVVVVGQDGLVANAAKYVKSLPILAINPDRERYDGILLPFDATNFQKGLKSLLKENPSFKKVTLAEAKTNDGQHLLAFNDLFIGPASHTSARYMLTYGRNTEQQSSSGIIVSTGAGSTGWLSSLMNMANGIHTTFNAEHLEAKLSFSIPWDTNELIFVVREPFQSKHSSTGISAGRIRQGEKLMIESRMPTHGVIFSDGIEADYIRFNSGTKVEIGTASQKAVLLSN
jgi:NAD kinase